MLFAFYISILSHQLIIKIMKTLFNLSLLLVFSHPLFCTKVIREKIFSAKMKKEISTIIVTPYIKPHNNTKRCIFCMVIAGNPERTLKQDIPDLQAKAKAFNTIYILPDGNYNNSWYVDSPVDQKSQYKTFIGSELVQYIDGHYPTKAEKTSRGILGWSMGGLDLCISELLFRKHSGL